MNNVSGDCTEVDTNLKIEVIPPQLSTHHGTTITYQCKQKHAERRGKVEATCQDGKISFTGLSEGDTPCIKIGTVFTSCYLVWY